ncbi:hypothetical protein DFH28DRAFT_1126772 [Melampsora americana]|nr:hypothetical protein DFH28DRAFT_1126772 [Melampsora americana]
MSFEPQPSSSRLTSNAPSPSDHQAEPETVSDENMPPMQFEPSFESQAQVEAIVPPAPVKKTRRSHVAIANARADKKVGTTILPVTRVTRAAKQDKDIKIVSKEAVFLISIATEFFVRKLTDSAFLNAKLEKRVFVKYNDVAKAVQANDEYIWLDDVIPLSKPLLLVLNDPTIPSASTALTNQLPQVTLPKSIDPKNVLASCPPPADNSIDPRVAETDTMEMDDVDELEEL